MRITLPSLVACSLLLLGPAHKAHALDQKTTTSVDVPQGNTTEKPKPHRRSYGQQMASWQRAELEAEDAYRKSQSRKLMATPGSEKGGTVESVHPLMSKHTPRLDFGGQ